jgi:uncharacterized protein
MIPFPPAQVQDAPATRELAFPGFNAFPLKGTVVKGAESPWFAVLVADSGPLDRDWRDPRKPELHGARALVQWLRDQGVGSLRYDKRIAGSRDPKLDSSLDAQAGDIRAALAAARDLPEARGRKLLLVGHGEGALLSLLVATDADALLLLAMPSQPMAKTLADQVALQLPAGKAAPSLAYLQRVFQAIRDRLGTPVPGPDVLPAMGRFATSLMAPETLAFVRATLDLDPWAMAGRSPVPLALVWGGKDIVATKPAAVPPTFPGAVLELPGANHLLKEEPRPRGDLDGASALEGYGDDRPLADLSPIAAWLKVLR